MSRLYFGESLVSHGQKRRQFLKKLEKQLEDFYFSRDKVITFRGDLNNNSRKNFLLKLLSSHYKMAVASVNTKK